MEMMNDGSQAWLTQSKRYYVRREPEIENWTNIVYYDLDKNRIQLAKAKCKKCGDDEEINKYKSDMSKNIKMEVLKEFEKNYLEYSDEGSYITLIGKNGIDIEEFISQALKKQRTEIKKEIEKVINDWKDNLCGTEDYRMIEAFSADIINNIKN